MATVLIAEDERELSSLLRRHLEDEGYRVLQAFNGQDALDLALRERPDLLILDWMLPRLDGLEVCRRVRRQSVIPILMLTARSEEIDRVLGLEVGADDYLTKPFSIRELLARVRAVFRRADMLSETFAASSSQSKAVVHGPLTVDPIGRTATLADEPIDLTPKELDLLYLLASNPGRAFSRDYLMEKVWGYESGGFDRTVDTHILRLRKKLGPLGERIETVWSVGYKFSTERKAGGGR
ncbi:MAG: response regulator transcription factor [Chloroflexi bacterium]|nr:response regulator transcription factor [Chloroflexota bacterium]